MSTTDKKRQVIRSEGRAIIASVYNYLREEYEFMKTNNHDECDLSPLANIRKRTALATGVSERTVTKILKEEKELPSPTAKFENPMKKRRKRDSKFDINHLDTNLIRKTIQNFHKEHGEAPTLIKLQAIFHDKIGFDGCLNTLRKLLLQMGYNWEKVGNKRRVLQVKPDDDL